jgi:uncharacterized protein VirK/YbjX
MNRHYRSYGTSEVRIRLWNLPLAKMRRNIEEILKNYRTVYLKEHITD